MTRQKPWIKSDGREREREKEEKKENEDRSMQGREKTKETGKTGEFVNYNLSACHRSPQATAKRIEGGRRMTRTTLTSRSDTVTCTVNGGLRK